MTRHLATLILLFLAVLEGTARSGTLVNITDQGTPTQTHSHSSGLYPPEKAVDGDLATFNHTASTSPGAAWELHFPSERPVGLVEIVTRDCCAGRLNGATLRLFDGEAELVFEGAIVDSGPLTTFSATIPDGTFARDLRIGFEPEEAGIVHLAEVRVFAPAGAPPVIGNFTSTPDGTLSWNVSGADLIEVLGVGPVAAGGSVAVQPATSTVYFLRATNDCATVLASAAVLVDGVPLPPRISEFSAYPDDWIEIWNPDSTSLDLTGWRLSDDPANLLRWSFPPGTTLAPGALLVIEKPFGLAREADSYLALLDPSGAVVSSFIYPEQFEGRSYGTDLLGNAVYFLEPSPGALNNGPSATGFLKGVAFSVARGHYETPFTLTLTPKTPGATLRFSLDGSEPTVTYTAPIAITTTTVVRALEHREGLQPSPSETQTYLFPAALATQPEFPSGFPTNWLPATATGALAPIPRPSDYEMDPDIVNAGPFTDRKDAAFTIPDALRALPSLCLTLPTEEMWDPTSGLHANALLRGRNWERAASMEIIDPSGTGFHIRCGLRIHGGRGRVAEMLKKSFRLYFRGEYGAKKLDYPLFEGMPEGGVDHLVLRGGNGKTWASPWRDLTGGGNSLPRVTYLRDQFLRDTHRAMNQPGFAGTFVHLYLNGLYWGLYNPVERPGGPFAANHFGGDADSDWDFLKWANGLPTQVVNGDTSAWDEVLNLSGTNPVANYNAISERVDLDNLADFLIANFYVGNTDWVGTRNNGYAFRSRPPFGDGKFRFLCWDGEESLLTTTANTTDSGSQGSTTTMELHLDLRPNPEYQLRFADRVHRHLVDEDGVLQPAASLARHNALADQIDRAIAAESARWGDLLRPTEPYTRQGDWLTEIANLNTNYLPTRPATVLAQLRADNLYPTTVAPVASLVAGSKLRLTAPAGEIWFTTDGSDPRLPGGAVAPSAQRFDAASTEIPLVANATWSFLDNGSDLAATNWTQTAFDDAAWATGPAPLGYGSITGAPLNTSVSYGPDALNKPITTYFRHRFHLTGAVSLADAFLRYFRDDGAVIYLNGTEVTRSNLPTDPINAATPALVTVSGADESALHSVALPAGLLRDGENVLALELHQDRPNSSDLGFDLSLVASTEGLPLAGDVHVKARALVGATWSALEEETYRLSDPVRDLVVSEIMYHPAAPSAAEINAGFDNDDFFEFLEIRNVGASGILLDGLRFTRGVDATLAGTLAPGASALVVASRAAFEFRYGTNLPVIAEWEAGDRLDNGGERLRLVTANTEVIRDFTYDDTAPWPTTPDGGGPSLVLIAPASRPEHALPGNWRASAAPGGNPGTSDATTFPGGDSAALLAYATGPSEAALLPDGTVAFTIEVNLLADDVVGNPEVSANLIDWQPAGSTLTRKTDLPTGAGRARVTFVTDHPPVGPGLFLRYAVSLRPPAP